MRAEIGVCPNCSEVVLRVGLSMEEALARLWAVGIGVVRMREQDFWGREVVPQDTGGVEELLVDADNPFLPDTVGHARLRLAQDRAGRAVVVARLSSQEQLFPTMLKIEKVLGGRWRDGENGSVEEYRRWKRAHRTPRAVREFIEKLTL